MLRNTLITHTDYYFIPRPIYVYVASLTHVILGLVFTLLLLYCYFDQCRVPIPALSVLVLLSLSV